jgi:nitrous oxidase accessory protein NosD
MMGSGFVFPQALRQCGVTILLNASRLRAPFILVGAILFAAAAAPAPRVGRNIASSTLTHRVLSVGPGEDFVLPSDAAIAAKAGDTVKIAEGVYIDCAVWPIAASPLTIEAAGGPVVIADKSCEDKALFVVKGNDVTIRGITFTGAKATSHNGAGIRAEGRHLTVEYSRFIDNEEGILGGRFAEAKIVVRDSVFKGNGNCVESCAHGIYVGHIALLRIERSQFIEQHIGHHVKSRAARTELIGNIIEDGPAGSASYLVDIPNGGALLMRDNTLEKGPHSDNPMVAIILGEEGLTNATPEIVIENNSFTNDMTGETFFLRNRTATKATLRGNRLVGKVQPLDGPGVVNTGVLRSDR